MADPSPLAQLQDFLERDPNNSRLRLDCIRAAIDENDIQTARALLADMIDSGDMAEEVQNLSGILAMREGDYVEATKTFSNLLKTQPENTALQFNQAWALAQLKRHDEALTTLSDATALSLPQAAMLRMQLLHQAGNFEDALIVMRGYVDRFPDHEGLLAAASTLAMDNSDPAWARDLAERASSHPEARTTLATLRLGEGDATGALSLFEDILDVQPVSPRAWIGKGLSQILIDQGEAASISLDKGAELFGTHIGSWIAAGWSYVTSGDLDTARNRFETALALDNTFSESHGALGVLDILENEIEAGRQKIRTARRLDKDCFSAALGQGLLLQGQGCDGAAQDIFKHAMDTPIDDSGQTLSSAIVKLGLG